MGPSSGEIERQIAAQRASMESKVVELRSRAELRARQARRVALTVGAVAVAAGVVALGALVYRRVTRPPTRRERISRLVPSNLGARLGRKRISPIPPTRVYIGDRLVTGELPNPRWEGAATRIVRAAATAGAGVLATRLIRAASEAARGRGAPPE